MLGRYVVRPLAATPSQRLNAMKLHYFSVMDNKADDQDRIVAVPSALTRQELAFCCLLCGWDVACGTCPFNWFNWNPKTCHTGHRRPPPDKNHVSAPERAQIEQAMETLGLERTRDVDTTCLSHQQVKEAFRRQALAWHPDCNSHPDAETMFKAMLAAYQVLLVHTRR
ncbi:hypothetical protein PsorP6_011858 [Peronosclerospora sorghi]|uniref:Uncharacterized protein n=1 Tax=Peronosclerospora sorghi TaxID=230839 RepID=A0ACC0WL97_9STRA|nr:hypothetical protein PsorP6_011858 [Peronosclerospora sorghi]